MQILIDITRSSDGRLAGRVAVITGAGMIPPAAQQGQRVPHASPRAARLEPFGRELS